MIILTLDCFKGFHRISKNCYDREDLQCYIDRLEEQYLCKLLGDELAALFIADLDAQGVPQTLIYQDIYYKFCFTVKDPCSCENETYQSFGIKDMLTGLVYYDYVSDQKYQNTMTGTVSYENSKSEPLGTVDLLLSVDKRWNQAALTSQAIVYFIKENIEDYPEFSGEAFSVSYLDLL